MMGLFEARLRGGGKFLDMMGAEASGTLEAIRYLESMLGADGAEAVARLHALSAAAAERRRVLVDELHRTFVTPLDREDIYNVSQAFEKMVTYATTTMEEMHLLHVAADDPIRRMVGLVREQAEELAAAMPHLARNPRVASDHANRVHDKEREVERVYRDAIRELFARATALEALPQILYRREIYRHISNMADRAVSAANVLGMVVMKIA